MHRFVEIYGMREIIEFSITPRTRFNFVLDVFILMSSDAYRIKTLEHRQKASKKEYSMQDQMRRIVTVEPVNNQSAVEEGDLFTLGHCFSSIFVA